jgi:hypothetical protein
MALAVTGTIAALNVPLVKAASYTTAQQVPTGTRSLPTGPSVAQDPLGRVWLAYENKTIGSISNPEIFFKTWNGTTWTSGQQVTLDPADDDATPFVASLSNGSMMIMWSSNRTGGNLYQLFYKLYSGTASKPLATTKTIRLTTSNLNDTQPNIIQDRNGRIWITWVRENVTSRPGIRVYISDTSTGPPGRRIFRCPRPPSWARRSKPHPLPRQKTGGSGSSGRPTRPRTEPLTSFTRPWMELSIHFPLEDFLPALGLCGSTFVVQILMLSTLIQALSSHETERSQSSGTDAHQFSLVVSTTFTT